VFPTPVFAGVVPSPTEVLGAPIGDHELSAAEIYRYLDAVDGASERVRTGSYGTTAMGNDLRYAIVGPAPAITDEALEGNAAAIRAIQNPSTPDVEVRALASTTRAFLFIQANVHGNEESGADAALQLLWHLADRTDCAARRVRRNAIVVILPMQNPDGRELDYRRNANGFDLNRDGLAMTQPEISGRWDLYRRFPPQLVVDAHEFGYTRSFFPPNDDPIYHEASRQVVRWINGPIARSLEALFEDRGWGYFHAFGYDFFAPIYGDTSPAFAFQAPALTLETNEDAPIDVRVRKNFDQYWVLLRTMVDRRTGILRSQHEAYREAVREGRRGLLERNRVAWPQHRLYQQVPDVHVRSYFLIPEGSSRWALRHVLYLLRRADVEVRRLTRPLHLRAFHRYGTSRVGPETIPRGAYWIPMAQRQKHWVQTVLNADTYTPVRQTYDITGWSLPLLGDLQGGWSGERVSPPSTTVGEVPDPSWPLPAPGTSIALLQAGSGVYAWEGAHQLEWLMQDLWNAPAPDVLSPSDIARGALDGYETLIMASGGSAAAERLLGEAGIRALRRWVREGGHFIGYKYGGTTLAPRIGLSSARVIQSPTGIEEGALPQIKLRRGPLRAGVGGHAWAMFAGDDVLIAPATAAAARYPAGARFASSGLALAPDGLPGSAAIVDEAYGRGRVTIFGFDANFRGETWGTQRILWNAIYGPRPPNLPEPSAAQLRHARAAARATARLELVSDTPSGPR